MPVTRSSLGPYVVQVRMSLAGKWSGRVTRGGSVAFAHYTDDEYDTRAEAVAAAQKIADYHNNPDSRWRDA